MANVSRQLLLASLLALAGLASAWWPAPTLVRVVLTLPLALFLPGFALIGAVAPGRRWSGERLTLAVGLSLALCVLAGLALNAVGQLNPTGWACALAVLTLAGCAVAALRGPSLDRAPQAPAFRLSASHVALFALSLGVAGFAVALAARGLDAHREYRFTEFWMTPHGQFDRSLVTIGVRNQEAKPMGYDISVVANGAVVGRWPSISVDPGAAWSTDFALSGDLLKKRVEAWLYRADDPTEVYRKVWISPVTATAAR